MDEQSLRYIDFVRRRIADTNAVGGAEFVAAELKRFGFKPKTAQGCVLCDIGKGKTRTAFYAELADSYQTSVMLSLAAALAQCKVEGARLIFDGDTDDEHDLLDQVSELYSVAFCGDLPSDGIASCYGVARSGVIEFSIGIVGGEWTDEAAVAQAVERYGMTVVSGGNGRFSFSYFDKAKCERALLDVERLAQRLDDERGTEHTLTVTKNYPPLKNDALCVDKVRYASGGSAKLTTSSECSSGISRYLDDVCGCMILAGENAHNVVARLLLRLAEMPSGQR